MPDRRHPGGPGRPLRVRRAARPAARPLSTPSSTPGLDPALGFSGRAGDERGPHGRGEQDCCRRASPVRAAFRSPCRAPSASSDGHRDRHPLAIVLVLGLENRADRAPSASAPSEPSTTATPTPTPSASARTATASRRRASGRTRSRATSKPPSTNAAKKMRREGPRHPRAPRRGRLRQGVRSPQEPRHERQRLPGAG